MKKTAAKAKTPPMVWKRVPIGTTPVPRARKTKPTPRQMGEARLRAANIQMAEGINKIAETVHMLNEQWWKNPKTGRRITRNKAEMIALMHSELSEALEAVRKDAMDDKLPQWRGETMEMADTVIRIFDYCAGHGLELGDAIMAKLFYNLQRADHKPENRLKKNGKKF